MRAAPLVAVLTLACTGDKPSDDGTTPADGADADADADADTDTDTDSDTDTAVGPTDTAVIDEVVTGNWVGGCVPSIGTYFYDYFVYWNWDLELEGLSNGNVRGDGSLDIAFIDTYGGPTQPFVSGDTSSPDWTTTGTGTYVYQYLVLVQGTFDGADIQLGIGLDYTGYAYPIPFELVGTITGTSWVGNVHDTYGYGGQLECTLTKI